MSADASETADVVVLGAGPAGLMAGLQLARAGRSVTILERGEAVGGMAGSFEVAGVRVDFGSHRLHPVAAPYLLAELRALLGDDLQTRRRRGRIALAGRWLAFPLRMGDLARNAPKPFLARVAFDTGTAPLRRPRKPTAADVIAARLGPTVARHFYTPYLTKLWGTSPDELSAELADRRVSARSGLDVVRRALRARQPEGGIFLYPRRGFGQISEVIADAALAAGASIRLGAGVSKIELGESHADVVLDDGSSLRSDVVCSTIPVPLLAKMAGAPQEVVQAGARLRHRAMVLSYLVLDADRLTTFDAHYFPGLDTPVSRLSEPKNFRGPAEAAGEGHIGGAGTHADARPTGGAGDSRGGDPDGVTVVCAELACWEGDGIWNATPEELADLVIATLEPLGFTFPKVLATEVRRIPRCYPVYTGTYTEDLAVIEGWADQQDRLLTFGRQGLFAPDNTHHALHMGWEAAGAIRVDAGEPARRVGAPGEPEGAGGAGEPATSGEAGGAGGTRAGGLTIDRARWRAARESFRSHVVED